MIRLAFPIVAALVAVYLYLRRPLTYVAFTLWIWFLTPLARRLVDYELGWADPNLLLLAPFFVSGVSALMLVLPRKDAPLEISPPFVLCGLAILYGFIMGMFQKPSTEVAYALLNWACPLLFALFLYTQWRRYEELRATIQRHVAIGVTLMGVYGIYQWFVAPLWDTFWLENISLNSIDPSFGQPTPMGIRVWSTLNAPGPFANVMMACLLILLVTSTSWKVPASIAGYSSFLLSSVRTAWLSWIVGLGMMLRGMRPSTIAKILGSMVLLGLCMIPIIQNPDIAPLIGDRVKTFSDLGHDESFNERRDMYGVVFGVVKESPFGHGLLNAEVVKNLVVDSGVLILLLELGWLGCAMYATGIVMFFAKPDRSGEDRFPGCMRAICIAYLSQLIGGQVFVGVTGAMFWMCLGMAAASGRWYGSTERLAAGKQAPAKRLPVLTGA